jgi:hypothetical protein
MIGGEQGGEEGFIAREDLAGVDVVCRPHGSSPDDQPVNAGAVGRGRRWPMRVSPARY